MKIVSEKHISDQCKQASYLTLQTKHLLTGLITEKYNVSEQKVDIDDSHSQVCYPYQKQSLPLNLISAIVGYQRTPKKKIWKDLIGFQNLLGLKKVIF